MTGQRSIARAARLLALGAALLLPAAARAQHLLVPMDEAQQNHLKAYGLTFHTLQLGQKVEWLLNYRGGAFLLPDLPDLRRGSALDGVTIELDRLAPEQVLRLDAAHPLDAGAAVLQLAGGRHR